MKRLDPSGWSLEPPIVFSSRQEDVFARKCCKDANPWRNSEYLSFLSQINRFYLSLVKSFEVLDEADIIYNVSAVASVR